MSIEMPSKELLYLARLIMYADKVKPIEVPEDNMKLVFCPKCTDLFKLQDERRECSCGESAGWYLTDGDNAEIEGQAIAVGIGNSSFSEAVRNRPSGPMGLTFEAWVMPKKVDSIKKVRKRRKR